MFNKDTEDYTANCASSQKNGMVWADGHHLIIIIYRGVQIQLSEGVAQVACYWWKCLSSPGRPQRLYSHSTILQRIKYMLQCIPLIIMYWAFFLWNCMQLDRWYKIHMSTSKCQYLGINCSLWHLNAQMKCVSKTRHGHRDQRTAWLC